MWFPGSFIAQAEPDGALKFVNDLARTPLSQIVIFVSILTVVRIALHPMLTKTAIHLRSGAYPVAKFFNEFADAIIYAGIFVFLIIRPFVLQTFFIPSGSMVQTLQVRDFIVANKWVYRHSEPQHGDIVVFRPPSGALFPGQDKETDFIKRVIGVPGDVIEVRNNVIFRNGEAQKEPYKVFTKPDPMAPPESKYITLTDDEVKTMVPTIDFKFVEYQGKMWPTNIEGQLVNSRMVAEEYKLTDLGEMAKLRDMKPAAIPKGYIFCMGDNRNGSFDGRGWGLVERRNVVGRAEFIWMPFSRMGSVR